MVHFCLTVYISLRGVVSKQISLQQPFVLSEAVAST